ncbi:MAG TPA: uroporphyrinogen-III synthase [Rhizomicrobium sp.]|nr:uroporphyrinogen-III synthase [Rhizomicrobium sp.]
MRVLVTRPRDDAEETAAKLAARGHQAVIAPLLDIRIRAGGDIALDGVQAVLVTSANGIRALATRTRRRDVKVLAVGAQSANTARELGFADVDDAGGDAQALAALAIANLDAKRGALFHASGAETRGNLAETLSARGFSIRNEMLYDAVAANALPPDAQNALAQGTLDAALFFSPRTARIFSDLVTKAKLIDACRVLRAWCISEAAASELRAIPFRELGVAAEPNQDALLGLL